MRFPGKERKILNRECSKHSLLAPKICLTKGENLKEQKITRSTNFRKGTTQLLLRDLQLWHISRYYK